MLFKCVVVLLVLGYAHAEIVNLRSCPTEQTLCQVHEVKVNPCAEAASGKPCRIKRGKSAEISFDITPEFGATKVYTQAFWPTAVADLPLVGMNNNACDAMPCPLVANEKSTFTTNLDIQKSFPSGIYDVKWKLYDEDNEANLCCFIVKIKLYK